MAMRRVESSVLAAGLFFILLACKKSEPAPAPSATAEPSAAPVATAAPTPEPAVTASASAAPTTPTPAVATTRAVVKPKTDGGIVDAGAKSTQDAAASAAPDAAAQIAADLAAIQACCRALSREADKPGLSQNQYKSAAAVCNRIAEDVKSGKANATKARTTIRAQLQGVQAPRSC